MRKIIFITIWCTHQSICHNIISFLWINYPTITLTFYIPNLTFNLKLTRYLMHIKHINYSWRKDVKWIISYYLISHLMFLMNSWFKFVTSQLNLCHPIYNNLMNFTLNVKIHNFFLTIKFFYYKESCFFLYFLSYLD